MSQPGLRDSRGRKIHTPLLLTVAGFFMNPIGAERLTAFKEIQHDDQADEPVSG
jgi:hypothetical protein